MSKIPLSPQLKITYIPYHRRQYRIRGMLYAMWMPTIPQSAPANIRESIPVYAKMTTSEYIIGKYAGIGTVLHTIDGTIVDFKHPMGVDIQTIGTIGSIRSGATGTPTIRQYISNLLDHADDVG